MNKQRFVGSGEPWLKSYTGAGNGMEQLWRNSNIYFYLSFCTWPSSQVPNYLCSLKSSKRFFFGFHYPEVECRMLEQPFLTHLKQKEIFTLKPYLHIFSSWFSCLKKDNISQWCADISTCQGSLINATTICVTVYKVLTMYFFHQRFIEALKLRAWQNDKSCYQISQLFALYSNTTCSGNLKG